jgi:hypothetical protein
VLIASFTLLECNPAFTLSVISPTVCAPAVIPPTSAININTIFFIISSYYFSTILHFFNLTLRSYEKKSKKTKENAYFFKISCNCHSSAKRVCFYMTADRAFA